jgi:hypothetical protein
MRNVAGLPLAIAIIAAGFAMTSVAEAVTFSQMIGDNDGYGVGIPDNGNTGSFAIANTDNRSAAEKAATNGAQLTDVYSAIFPGFGPNPSTGSFIFSPLNGTATSATLRIDMADFQASTFGPILANINGVSLSLAFDDGFQASVVRDFVLNAAQLAAVNAAGFLSLNLDRNGSGDFIAFDYVQLTAEVNSVPLPGALPLFATGLGALGLLGWRRKRKQMSAA